MSRRFASLRACCLPLCILAVCIGGGCAREIMDEYANANHPMSLALSLKNVGAGPDASTRMTSAVTQAGREFRGIEHLYIIPFNTESIQVEHEEARLGNENVVLGSTGISRYGLVSNNNSHLFGSAFVPTAMNRVLAYGKSQDDGDLSTRESKHTYGVLSSQGLENPSGSDDISFHLEPILTTGETDELSEVTTIADGLLEQLNVVLSLMAHSDNASVLGILDAVKRENQILSCSYATFDQIRTEIQTALLRIPFESMELIEEISTISSALSTFSNVLTAAGSTFPSAYGIPDGSIGFSWNGNGFVRLIGGVNIALVDPSSYCYPPSLWYHANSSIKTSNNNNVTDQYVQTNAHWEDILVHYTDGQSVTSVTQSVAIEDPLQYGVGMLELSLDLPGEEAASLIDGCPLTGIIIGDQKDVDFDFLPGTGPSRYVFDNVIGNTIRIGISGTVVQTLVLQTVEEAPVHFALEFRNNTGYTRRCQQGDILPWCKFYLAGIMTLGPDSGATQPSQEVLTSVFTRDHKTTVKIKVESLRNAYNTVPDLHSPQLEIGLVTEMKWAQITPQSVKLDF